MTHEPTVAELISGGNNRSIESGPELCYKTQFHRPLIEAQAGDCGTDTVGVAKTNDLGTREWASAEELAEPVLFFPAAAVGVASPLRFMVTVTGVAVTISVPWLRWRGLGHRAFDDFVEFAAVKPYSATFRAVVNFNSAPVGHNEF